jgi:GT2 family glycosyltransferase
MLAACLDALAATLDIGDEVVVADSCSTTDDTASVATDHARRAGHGVRVLRCPRPGASLARNTGWRAAAHDHVAFVDDDVRVLPGWATALRTTLAAHPDAAFVTGRLGLAPGAAPVERPVAFLDLAAPGVIDHRTVHDLGHGANLAVRRAALEAVGGFDESFGPGARWPAAEDLDLLDRLVAAGLTGRYEPAAAAWHLQWRARRHLLPLEWAYGTGQGARLARLWHRDRVRARSVVRSAAWDDGVRDLAGCVRRGYEFGALMAGARLAGTARGALGYAVARHRTGAR